MRICITFIKLSFTDCTFWSKLTFDSSWEINFSDQIVYNMLPCSQLNFTHISYTQILETQSSLPKSLLPTFEKWDFLPTFFGTREDRAAAQKTNGSSPPLQAMF